MIHYFNPGHETAVLNRSKFYMAPANVVRMQKELAFLSFWYANPDDYILIENELPDDFVSLIYTNLNNTAKGITKEYFSTNQDNVKNQEVTMWGVSPQAIHFFEVINNDYGLNLSIPEWNDKYVPLCSRQAAQKCLCHLIGRTNKIANNIVPQFFDTLGDIEQAVIRNNDKQFLAKAPYSSSGRGLLWLPIGELTRTEKQILHGHLKKQGCVSLEKVLDKCTDFAMEFHSHSGEIVYKGLSLFKTNPKGAYLGNFIGKQAFIENHIYQYIDKSVIEEVKTLLTEYLKREVAPFYTGYIGVDMMIYKEDDEYKLQPCLEINLRNNMGVVALNIERNVISDDSSGEFHIDFSPKDGEIYEKHIQMSNEYPAVFENKRLKSGYLPLCPVSKDNRYRAYILIND